MEINAAIYIQIFLVNSDIYVPELDVLIPIQLGLILEWGCSLI
jgi:hypothetical protein